MPRLGIEFYFRVLVLYGITLCLMPLASVCAQPADNSQPPIGTQMLVFLRAEKPVFVQLTVMLGGQELREARAQRVTSVFNELDANHDGMIDPAERDATPKALRKLGVGEKWSELLLRLDTTPVDQNISAAELASFIQARFGPPVVLVARPRGVRRANQAVELFELLDDNQDQVLNEAEFAALSSRLHKLDADGDDSFSVIEVEPFRNPFSPRSTTMTAPSEDATWVLVEAAAEVLLKRFDQQPPLKLLTAAELGLPQKLVDARDTNHDGGLDLNELRSWLPTVPPQYQLQVSLPQGKVRQTNVTWADVAAPPPASPQRGNSRAKVVTTKNLEVAIAGLPLQLQISGSRASQGDNLSFYKLQFRRSDADKNKYLDKTEFAMLNLPGATFEAVDTDGNGQVFENEIEEFLELENLVDQGHVQITYDSNEFSLFSLLDLNKDNRLTPRECIHVTAAWKPYDVNHDGQLAWQELSGKLRLTAELVKPRLFQDIAAAPGGAAGEPIIRPRTAAPLWFRGMDRNQDGDISRREFIGNDAAFKKWDRDGDGLISEQEAGT